MRLSNIFDFISDHSVDDPVETASAVVMGFVPLLHAVVTSPPSDLLGKFIAIIPALGGVWVAHRSMERTHEYRMAKLGKAPSSGEMLRIPSDFPFDSAKAAKPDEPTVDLK